jgi:hypothetical protein
VSAPDWIICRLHSRDEAVLELSALTGEEPYLVVGRCVEWFRWIDQHLNVPETTLPPHAINVIVGATGEMPGGLDYAGAMERVGWIVLDDAGRVQIVDYEKNFGRSAKRRAMDAKRKKCGRRADAHSARRPLGARADADGMRTSGGQIDDLHPQPQPPLHGSVTTPLPTVRTEGRDNGNSRGGGSGALKAKGSGVDGLRNVSEAELKNDEALSERYEEAVSKGLVGRSEHDYLKLVAAAERALSHGRNAGALFASLVNSQLWRNLSNADFDRANERTKARLFGESRRGPGEVRTCAAEPA